mmetsp:Transcript_23684/g.76365  ORF Transcript_23684/g.76365 Transcript_23684/m.76365 type:complete len:80 (+) Transcript_23684:612-851(+)
MGEHGGEAEKKAKMYPTRHADGFGSHRRGAEEERRGNGDEEECGAGPSECTGEGVLRPCRFADLLKSASDYEEPMQREP